MTEKSDVVTYEFENVDLEVACFIEEAGESYHKELFRFRNYTKSGKRKNINERIAAYQFQSFQSYIMAKECEEALKETILPAVIKTCRGGYDGKGQLKLKSKRI